MAIIAEMGIFEASCMRKIRAHFLLNVYPEMNAMEKYLVLKRIGNIEIGTVPSVVKRLIEENPSYEERADRLYDQLQANVEMNRCLPIRADFLYTADQARAFAEDPDSYRARMVNFFNADHSFEYLKQSLGQDVFKGEYKVLCDGKTVALVLYKDVLDNSDKFSPRHVEVPYNILVVPHDLETFLKLIPELKQED